MTCLKRPKPPISRWKMRDSEGPTISALPVGMLRVRLSPVKSWRLAVRLSPYQVKRSPAVSDSDSQGSVDSGSVICGQRVGAAVGAGELADAVDVEVVERAAEADVERRAAEARLAQAVLDLGDLALLGGDVGGDEALALVDQDVQEVRPPGAGDEGAAVDDAGGVQVEVALEVAEELEVGEVLVRHHTAHAPGQVGRGVVPVDLPAPLVVALGVLDEVAGGDAAGAFGRGVAQLVAEPQEALGVGVDVEGRVLAPTHRQKVGEAERGAAAVRIADVRHQQA